MRESKIFLKLNVEYYDVHGCVIVEMFGFTMFNAIKHGFQWFT